MVVSRGSRAVYQRIGRNGGARVEKSGPQAAAGFAGAPCTPLHNGTRMRIPFFFFLSLGILLGQETRTESYLGNLAPVISSIQRERGFPMDYAHRQGISIEQWRARGRAEVQRALSYTPRTVPLDM